MLTKMVLTWTEIFLAPSTFDLFCVSEITTSTTARPRPPWFPETPPSWSELDKQTTETNQTSQNSEQTLETEPEQTPPAATDEINDSEDIEDESIEEPHVIKVKVPKPLTPVEDRPSLQTVTSNSEAEVVTIANFTQYCAPVTARGLFWNWTLAGDTAVLQCPEDSTGELNSY